MRRYWLILWLICSGVSCPCGIGISYIASYRRTGLLSRHRLLMQPRRRVEPISDDLLRVIEERSHLLSESMSTSEATRHLQDELAILSSDLNASGMQKDLFSSLTVSSGGGVCVDRSKLYRQESRSDWRLVFLGTGSMYPSLTRGTSSMVLQFLGVKSQKPECWLFDCGEGTQTKAQGASVHISKVTRVFITHLHGDHCSGLPGFLAFQNRNESPTLETIDIYGPHGLRNYLKTSLSLTGSRLGFKWRVHELKQIPHSFGCTVESERFTTSGRHNEDGEGNDIYPDHNGVYVLIDNPDVVVKAAALVHSAPTVGFVIEEKEGGQSLNGPVIESILKRNSINPLQMYRDVRALRPGSALTFSDGTVLSFEAAHLLRRTPRKVVFCQDTRDSSKMYKIASNPDVLVHEATLAPVKRGKLGDGIEEPLTAMKIQECDAEAYSRFHSTPSMAARFANRLDSACLILTHFSQRYKGDDSLRSFNTMLKIEQIAADVLSERSANVSAYAAWDGAEFFVERSSNV